MRVGEVRRQGEGRECGERGDDEEEYTAGEGVS
jgi:hypothetical protein